MGVKMLVSAKALVRPFIWIPVEDKILPLWAPARTLYYRVDEEKLMRYVAVGKSQVMDIFNKALAKWEDAPPIRFAENVSAPDFVITANPINDSPSNGRYVLAKAFYPTKGTDVLTLYPRMFKESESQQVATLAHEIGHIFGLGHPFSENGVEKKPFGDTRKKLSIMNYDFAGGVVTPTDKADLKSLYNQVWSGALRSINGVPIAQVMPYHDIPR